MEWGDIVGYNETITKGKVKIEVTRAGRFLSIIERELGTVARLERLPEGGTVEIAIDRLIQTNYGSTVKNFD